MSSELAVIGNPRVNAIMKPHIQRIIELTDSMKEPERGDR